MSRSRSPSKLADECATGVGNYVFQKTVGEGNFAKVKLARHKLTNQLVAIKVIDKSHLDEKKLSKLHREVRIMKMLRHPHIVRLYEVLETKNTLFLVMEYASKGELYDYLVSHGRLKEADARVMFRQILSAVNYCHKKRVIHRDLKAENLLLDENMDIKIADFGFSNYFDPDAKLDTFCGSPPYAAPELFQGRRYTGPEVDLWSLGVILYVLTTGCLPFDGKNLQEMRKSVCRGKYRIPFYLSEACERVLCKLLVRDPLKRASLEILVDDPWINEGSDMSPIRLDLSQKIVEEDADIITAMEAKFHLDKQTILHSLREGIYDDVAAVYYLLIHERDQRGGDLNAVTAKMASLPAKTESHAKPAVASSASSAQADSATPASSSSRSESTSSRSSATPSEVTNGVSNQVANAVTSSAATRRSGATRRRRFTVGDQAELQKYADEDEEAAKQLKKIQDANTTREEGDAVAPPNTLAEGTKRSAAAVAEERRSHASKIFSRSNRNSKTKVDDNVNSSSYTTASGDTPGPDSTPRKRNTSFVGMIKSRMSRRMSVDSWKGDGAKAKQSSSTVGV